MSASRIELRLFQAIGAVLLADTLILFAAFVKTALPHLRAAGYF